MAARNLARSIPRMPISSRLPQPTDDKLFQGANRGTHIALAAPGVLLPAPEAAYQVAHGQRPLLRLR
jgi:hypothetical protein